MMGKLEMRVHIHPDFLEVRARGRYDLFEAIAKFAPVLAYCRVLGLDKVFIDFSQLTGGPAAVEKVLYALGVVEHLTTYRAFGGRELHIAYLGSPPYVTSYKPGLEIARSHHIDAEVFTNETMATDWLKVNIAQHPGPSAPV